MILRSSSSGLPCDGIRTQRLIPACLSALVRHRPEVEYTECAAIGERKALSKTPCGEPQFCRNKPLVTASQRSSSKSPSELPYRLETRSGHFDLNSVRSCASQQPFRNRHISADPMTAIAVVDVWKAVEARA